MLMKDITPGRQVWFQESGVGEDGKTERRMCQGTVTGMDGKKYPYRWKAKTIQEPFIRFSVLPHRMN